MFNRRHITAFAAGAVLASGSALFLANASRPAFAADEKKDEHMSNQELARDARDHLQKAHEEIIKIEEPKHTEKDSKDLEEARRAADKAIASIDSYMEKVYHEKPTKK